MLAVGSAVIIGSNTFIVCGYRPIEQDGHVDMGYLLVPYPLGYVNIDSLSLVTADNDYPVAHTGFRNNDAQAYDCLLEQVRDLGRNVTAEAVVAIVNEATEELLADLVTIEGKEA